MKPDPSHAPATMTLRENFAGLALQALLSCDVSVYPPGVNRTSPLKDLTQGWAKVAVAYADALLAELAKEKP
jgi:hypothetical protein